MEQDTLTPQARPLRELPTFYYHTHFLEMLDFVGAHYAHVLDAQQHAFREAFSSLSFTAQCLYVRLVNRKGLLFARNRLRYPEIDNIGLALEELGDAGFLSRPTVEHIDQLLALLTRPQLFDALSPHLAGLKRSMKKSDMLALIRERKACAQQAPREIGGEEISGKESTPGGRAREPIKQEQITLEQMDHRQAVQEAAVCEQSLSERLFAWLPSDGVVLQGRAEDVRFLLFLFFGRIQEGLTQFTMRDLGLVRTQDGDDVYRARFEDREDAQHAYFFAVRLHDLQCNAYVASRLAAESEGWPLPESPVAADLRDQLALALGRALESDPEIALRIYARGESAACSERAIRLLLSSGRKEEAGRYLERCIEEPASVEEGLMASDLYARKFGRKRTSLLTDRLREAAVIEIDEAYRGAPESAAVAWFRARGQRAFWVENSLWRTLFGLLFWDMLFNEDAPHLHSPFDRLPAVLAERRFAREYGDGIRQRLALLDDPPALKHHLLRISVAHFGTHNGIFRWRQPVLDAIYAVLEAAPASAVRQMLTQLCDDYRSSRHGYPDLMVIDDSGVRFVEIKTEGDQLRRNQLLRLEQLTSAGFRADVVRLRWVLDPTQTYVVVDVETTGGRGEQHRVTEIGAVKVLDGKIVDEFQTLLNPQRSIPPGITRLTGITPAMVADAPIFADVADEFANFISDAIFVAHNVNFDYRFIAQEFQRIGRAFRMPKLCTCASMRKLYPGMKSYSLANLAAAYDISLNSHHRALCDAQAAAHLLLMVNEKRMEAMASETGKAELMAR